MASTASNIGALSPLEDFLLSDPPGGLGLRNQAHLADRILEQNTRVSTKKSSLRSEISNIFKYAKPLRQPIKDALVGIATKKYREQIDNAIEMHEEEFVRRRKPLEIIRRNYGPARKIIFFGLEPLIANASTAPESLLSMLDFMVQEVISRPLEVVVGLPEERFARSIWTGLSERAKITAKKNRGQNPKDILSDLEQRVKLLLVPRRMCVHTTMVFFGDETERGYIWYMPWDWRTPAQMPPTVLNAWKEEFMKPLEERSIDGNPIEEIKMQAVFPNGKADQSTAR